MNTTKILHVARREFLAMIGTPGQTGLGNV